MVGETYPYGKLYLKLRNSDRSNLSMSLKNSPRFQSNSQQQPQRSPFSRSFLPLPLARATVQHFDQTAVLANVQAIERNSHSGKFRKTAPGCIPKTRLQLRFIAHQLNLSHRNKTFLFHNFQSRRIAINQTFG